MRTASAGPTGKRSERLLDDLYGAATNFDLWQVFLKSLAAEFDAFGAVLFSYDLVRGESTFGADYGFSDPALFHKYVDYVDDDPRTPNLFKFPGKPLSCALTVPREKLHASRLYREFLRPIGIEYTLGVLVEPAPHHTSSLNVFRGPGAEPFGQMDCDRFGSIASHFRRAIDIQRRFMELDAERWAAIDVLDHIPMGVVIVDADARVLHANAAAETIAEKRRGFLIQNNQVWASDPRDAYALHENIRAAIDAVRIEGYERGDVAVTIQREESSAPIHVRICPVWKNHAPFVVRNLSRPVAALFVTDPDQPQELAPELLTRLYGLTPTEANVLTVLLKTGSAADAARELDISINTARSHLRKLFRKTDTRNQGELIATVTASPTWQTVTAKPPPDSFWALLESK